VQGNAPTVIVGLTGGVGAGKSLAESLCRSWNIPTADADRWAHDVLDSDPDAIRAVRDEFQRRYSISPLTAEGTVNRAVIAEKAFADREFLRFLEALIHPRVRSRAAAWIEQQRRARLPLAVLVVPLLIESGMAAQVDYVVVIAASAATRTARLAASRGWHKEEISRRMAAQLSDAERRQHADCVVCNEGTRAQFAQALRNALQEAERHERRPPS